MLSEFAPAFTVSLMVMVFLEGLAAFVSPCILPMLPVYVMYLSGDDNTVESGSRRRLIINTLGFVLGFTLVFVLLGAGASWLGAFLQANRLLLQRISGAILILFGLHYTGLLRIGFLNREAKLEADTKRLGFFKSIVFGVAFSFGWTPCLGPMLGSALTLAGNAATLWQGMLLLFLFSMGLGIPFLLTAFLYSRLTGVFSWLRKHHRGVRIVSGILLILFGILLLFDLFGYYASLFI